MTSVTIKDVAARASMSPKTVSRVINGEAHVRPEVRDLDYRPNAFARGLSSSRSFLIGLFFDDPASAYAAEVQRGAMERSHRLGHHLLVDRLEPADQGWRQSLAATLKDVRLGGAVLTPSICDDEEVVRTFAEHHVPVVRISPERSDHGPQVRMDDRRAVCELVGLGHRRIGFVGGNRSHRSAGRRWTGYLDARNAAGPREGARALCCHTGSWSGTAALPRNRPGGRRHRRRAPHRPCPARIAVRSIKVPAAGGVREDVRCRLADGTRAERRLPTRRALPQIHAGLCPDLVDPDNDGGREEATHPAAEMPDDDVRL